MPTAGPNDKPLQPPGKEVSCAYGPQCIVSEERGGGCSANLVVELNTLKANLWKVEWSTYGFSWAHRYCLDLGWTELMLM